jgi:hypothetical protein
MSLFPNLQSAVISPCGHYRYRLDRCWDADRKSAVFVMLNPSTADAAKDDPTIRRCIGFAKTLECGGIIVVNLFAFRATKPEALRVAADPVGPENDRYILDAAREGEPVIAAWGTHGGFMGRERTVGSILVGAGISLKVLGHTKDGCPRHPLYVRGDAQLIGIEFRSSEATS